MKNDLSIMLLSCDKYKRLWPNFFSQLKKYWQDFDLEVIINSESASFDGNDLGLNIINPNGNLDNCKTWSVRFLRALDKVKTEFVMLFIDDYFLKAPVDISVVEDCLQRMKLDDSIASFIFSPSPKQGKTVPDNEKFMTPPRFCMYRVNTQIGIWRVDYLKRIVRKYESPWDFELSASLRSSFTKEKFYTIKRGIAPVFSYDYGALIHRGQLNKKYARYFEEKEGLDMDMGFPIMKTEYVVRKKPILRFFDIMTYIAKMIISLFRK